MKQKALAVAIKKIVWAQLVLSAALAVPAFAQSQPVASEGPSSESALGSTPAITGQVVTPTAPASGTQTPKPATSTSGTEITGPSDNKVAQLKKFEVTGSLIRSSDKTGFNQVQTVTQKEMLNSGATTVSDFLRGTSANSGSSWGEDTVLSQSPGGTGIALRGMSEKYTLVLVDGQRAAPYAFANGGTDTFFDVNTLPLNMIDRIEIVKTGAVSQYGSDAIAGVVNVITKKNFQGLQLDASAGGAQHGGEGTTSFSMLGGFGNLNSDRFHVTAALSHYRSSGVSMSQRDFARNENYAALPGGYFSQPSSFFMTPSGPQALSPCGPTGTVTSALNNLQTKSDGTVCSQNGASGQSLAAQTERTSAKVHATFKVSDNVEAFGDIWGSHNTTSLMSGLAGFGAGALVPSLYYTGSEFAAFAPTVGGNALTYYFPKAQAVNTTSNFYRVSTGMKGSLSTTRFGDWDWAASYGHSQSVVSNAYTNQVNASAVLGYTDSVTPATFSAATLNGLPGVLGTSYNQGISKLDVVDATISTPNLFKLPAGDLGIGLGAQFQHQSENIGPGSTAFVNPYTQAVDGNRNVAALYYQADIPIVRGLTFGQSGRYDRYNDFGGVYSPRFALRYQPVRDLTMYASYNRGFRAPTLIELYQAAAVTYQTVNNQNVNEYFVGNPSLQPERTKNFNIGFQSSPTRTTDFGLDYYRIDVSNVIGQPNIVAMVNANPGQPMYKLGYTNLSYLRTEGFEATFKQVVPTTIGTFTLAGDWAYVWYFTMPMSGVATDFAGNNGANNTVFGGLSRAGRAPLS